MRFCGGLEAALRNHFGPWIAAIASTAIVTIEPIAMYSVRALPGFAIGAGGGAPAAAACARGACG